MTPSTVSPDRPTIEATLLASRAMMGVIARSVAPVLDRISLPQFRVLVLVAAAGQLRTGALAELSGVHPSTLTRTADRLVRDGWVRRVENPLSRREVLIELTDTGMALVKEVFAIREADITQILSRAGKSDQQRIRVGFAAFAAAAGEPDTTDLIVLGG